VRVRETERERLREREREREIIKAELTGNPDEPILFLCDDGIKTSKKNPCETTR